MGAEIPFLTDPLIHARVEAFKAGLDQDLLGPPLDAAYIAEVCLSLQPIPLKRLWDDLRIDAALTPDLGGFYVDEESYRLVYGEIPGQAWRENRLRFSIAHEIGHFVLHRHAVESIRYGKVEEYLAWRKTLQGPCSPEYQADESAGRLLVPRENLLAEYDRVQAAFAVDHADWWRIEGAREMIAKRLGPRFGVNHRVIGVRLEREGLWPVE